jgi:hypothetical protein
MALKRLSEFMHLSGLDERSCLRLLEAGNLPARLGAAGEVLIEMSQLDTRLLAEAPPPPDLLEEETAAAVLRELQPIVEEALAIALRWRAARSSRPA